MPELPDLLYIREYLRTNVVPRTISEVGIKQPVVLRTTLGEPFDESIRNRQIEDVRIRGPFLHFLLSGDRDLILNLMLAGRLQHQHEGERPEGYLCCSFHLDDGTKLNLCDSTIMAKVYSSSRNSIHLIPRFSNQGVDISSAAFTPEVFVSLTSRHRRKQVRVFLTDQTIVSAIGNAYADEILFDARIHPKTFIAQLSSTQLEQLYSSIIGVLHWATGEVRKAAQPIHMKVRDHLRVRNRKEMPCPRCGTTIRREGVRGHDVFFCPNCQPPTRRHFLDWRNLDIEKRS